MNRWIKKYEQIIFGMLFLFYFLYTFTNALGSAKEVAVAVLLTLVLYVQSVGELFYFYKKQGRPRIQDWMRVSLFVMLVLNFMKIVNASEGSIHLSFSVTSVSLLDAPFTMLVIVFAFLSLDVGYIIGKLYKVKRRNERYSIKRKTVVFWILLFSTMIQAYLLFSGVSGYGSDLEYTTGYISLAKTLAGILNPFALIISAYIIFIENSQEKVYKNIFYIAVGVQVFLGLLSGMKENALMPLLYIGIVFLLGGWKLPRKLLIVGLFMLALLYPFNNAYRDVINDRSLNTGSSTLNMVIAINNLLTKPLAETLLSGTESYEDRGSMYPYLQYSINIEPEWTYYKHMTRYMTLPIVWLAPRALWPDKPRSDIGAFFYEKLTGRKTNSITPTNIGWAYFEGGLFFVLIVFILIGAFLEIPERKNIFKPIILLFYVLMIHFSIKPEWDPYFMFSSVLQFFVMYWVLLKLLGTKKLGQYK